MHPGTFSINNYQQTIIEITYFISQNFLTICKEHDSETTIIFENCKTIWQLRRTLWAKDISRYIYDGFGIDPYPIVQQPPGAPFTNVTEIPAWISNYTHYKVSDEITYPFLSFNNTAVEVCEWIRNVTPQFTGQIITYPCWN